MIHKNTIFASLLSTSVLGDMYLQNPMGSNNRLDENSREVRNQHRLFDSQNNNRFGYNQNGMKYYTDSIMNIEWTVQHGCGPDSNVNCNMVLQYACGENIRDGEEHTTIPAKNDECIDDDCNTDKRYGMHEPNEYYQHCALRSRNEGLFKADQRLHGTNARYTRQDNNARRFGNECNEERDYYPYWHPTIWHDIAVLTDDVDRCKYYQEESENVKDRHYCKVPTDWLEEKYEHNFRGHFIPLNETACKEFAVEHDVAAEWTLSPKHGIPAPDCRETEYSRDNHLGNANGRRLSSYQWKVPKDLVHDKCVIRIRYNITSNDYDGWETFSDNEIVDDQRCMCRNNYGVDLWSQYGLSGYEARERGYQLKNNNLLKIYKDFPFKLRMAFNTDQVGRTFEDRSSKITFYKLDPVIEAELNKTKGTVWNLVGRGKIGNNVEVFPNTEYEYSPAVLRAKKGDYIHIQWSGSDTNPHHNDGSQVDANDETYQIIRGKDRHNIVMGESASSVRPHPDFTKAMNIFGLSKEDAVSLATDGIAGGDNEHLNAGSAYFNLGLRKLDTQGKWNFFSTQNNRFGVRVQKGTVVVS